MFFDTLLQKLQTAFHFNLEDYMDGVAIRARPLRKTVRTPRVHWGSMLVPDKKVRG